MDEVRAERIKKWQALQVKRGSLHRTFSDVMRHPSWPGSPKPWTPELIQKAYEAGLLAVTSLKHGVYYYGECRNAEVARWDANRQVFTYIRKKFGSIFPEDISTIENDNGYDLFLPVAEIEPEEEEKIPPDWKGNS